jgi:Rieske Fe-S protein
MKTYPRFAMNSVIPRREFLEKCSALALGIATAVPCFNGCAITGFSFYKIKSNDGKIILEVSQFPELNETGNGIQLDDENSNEEILLLRKSENEFIALSPVCTHLGCSVRRENSFFRCPCHGSTYSLDGKVIRGPAEKPLTIFHTEFSNGNITIYL